MASSVVSNQNADNIAIYRVNWGTSITFPTFIGQQGIIQLSTDAFVGTFWNVSDGFNIAKIAGEKSFTATRNNNTITLTRNSGYGNCAWQIITSKY